jgi:hypothetical protein
MKATTNNKKEYQIFIMKGKTFINEKLKMTTAIRNPEPF